MYMAENRKAHEGDARRVKSLFYPDGLLFPSYWGFFFWDTLCMCICWCVWLLDFLHRQYYTCSSVYVLFLINRTSWRTFQYRYGNLILFKSAEYPIIQRLCYLFNFPIWSPCHILTQPLSPTHITSASTFVYCSHLYQCRSSLHFKTP